MQVNVGFVGGKAKNLLFLKFTSEQKSLHNGGVRLKQLKQLKQIYIHSTAFVQTSSKNLGGYRHIVACGGAG